MKTLFDYRLRFSWSAFSLMLLLVVGCTRGPSAIPTPSYDPSGIATEAMELYDSDSDGYVAGEELDRAFGLKAAIETLDTNNDSRISEEEIADRVRAWDRMRIGMMGVDAIVNLDGEPLIEAKVTFEPEEFMQGSVEAGHGITNMLGGFRPRVPKDKRPSENSPPGLQAGIYKVRISKEKGGSEIIPQRYNTETVLAQQVSKDDPAILNKRVIFELKSK